MSPRFWREPHAGRPGCRWPTVFLWKVVIGFGPIGSEMVGADHVIDHLGYVGGMITAALDVLGDEQKMRAQTYGTRIFHHVGQELAEQTIVDFVNLAVLVPYRFRQFGVAAGIGIQHLL